MITNAQQLNVEAFYLIEPLISFVYFGSDCGWDFRRVKNQVYTLDRWICPIFSHGICTLFNEVLVNELTNNSTKISDNYKLATER